MEQSGIGEGWWNRVVWEGVVEQSGMGRGGGTEWYRGGVVEQSGTGEGWWNRVQVVGGRGGGTKWYGVGGTEWDGGGTETRLAGGGTPEGENREKKGRILRHCIIFCEIKCPKTKDPLERVQGNRK